MTKLEQDIQKDILDFLAKNGFLAIKHNNIGIYARAGVPDILACSNQGKFIGIEVKRPGEKPKPIQQAFLDAINKLNGVAFYAISVEDVYNKLKERGLLK
jgi:hypothetical protein